MAVNTKDKGKMDDQIANREAAAAGLRSLERLVLQQSPSECLEIADQTVAKYKKAIFTLNRAGHARFRRGPPQSASAEPEGALATAPVARNRVPPPTLPPPTPQQAMFPEILTLDLAKPKDSFSVLGVVPLVTNRRRLRYRQTGTPSRRHCLRRKAAAPVVPQEEAPRTTPTRMTPSKLSLPATATATAQRKGRARRGGRYGCRPGTRIYRRRSTRGVSFHHFDKYFLDDSVDARNFLGSEEDF